LLFPLGLILFLDWYRQYVLAIRQVLFTLPGLMIGAGTGLERLEELFGRIASRLTLGAVVLISVAAMVLHDRADPADWAGLANYLRTHLR